MSDALVPFNPATLAEAEGLAKTLSQSSLIPTALKGKPADVFLILLKGRELGLSPIQSLGMIHVIEGKPAASAELKVGLCLQRKEVCEYFRVVESTDQVATYETKRVGSEAVRLSWTIGQATKAGLTGKANWKNHTAAMLRARCSSALATAVYPDLTQGLLVEDEAEEIRARLDGIHQAPEKDITPAQATRRTAEVKGALKAQMQQAARVVIDPVPPTPPGPPPRPSKVTIDDKSTPSPWDLVVEVCKKHGYAGAKAASIVKGATGKDTRASITMDDVQKVRDALGAVASPQTVPEPPDDIPAHDDKDAPPPGELF